MIEVQNVYKEYGSASNKVIALDNVSLKVAKGEIFGVIGYSGAGKSTLIRLLNQLTKQDKGNVIVDGVVLNELSDSQLRKERENIGMIFQHFNLLANATVLDNVLFALKIIKYPKDKQKARALELLELVKISDKADAYPAQLSGGQKQRVAIARALVTSPKVLLCDEATSALDPETTKEILKLLLEINEKLNITIVLISHEMHVIKRICDRIAVMDEGRIIEMGDIHEVFNNPQQPLTKRFISIADNFSDLDDISKQIKDNYSNGILFRLLFDDDKNRQPIVSHIARELDIDISILYGAIDVINSGSLGSLIIHLNEDESKVKEVQSLLDKNNVKWEVL
ncbi:MAG: ATP-binding cassette domain-containing protein [Erysipelotrichales bacterium]